MIGIDWYWEVLGLVLFPWDWYSCPLLIGIGRYVIGIVVLFPWDWYSCPLLIGIGRYGIGIVSLGLIYCPLLIGIGID